YFKSDIPEQVEQILMRALEKDREKRYQSAWEMQFDIDQFLSQYEFTPSNIHLSNFLKQLFLDEMDQEKERHAKLSSTPTAPYTGEPEPELISASHIELVSDPAQEPKKHEATRAEVVSSD